MQTYNPRIFRGLHCTLTICRPAPGVVLAIFEGRDVGEFNEEPFRELAQDVEAKVPVEIFIDAREVPGVSIDVSAGWAQWMKMHRDQINTVSILCGSRFIELTANFVQRFTQFGQRMRIYTEADAFDGALRVASGASPTAA